MGYIFTRRSGWFLKPSVALPKRLLILICALAVRILFSDAGLLHAQNHIDVEHAWPDLSVGHLALDGPCLFHTGDDPGWSARELNTEGWESLLGTKPWSEQGHMRYTGFAWYRCAVNVSVAPGAMEDLYLLIAHVDDAYELYWNGHLVGRNGRLQNPQLWIISQPSQLFRLGGESAGVLAIRVWKAPLFSDDTGREGGLVEAPLLGYHDALADVQQAREYRWLRGQLFLFGENLLCAAVGLLSLLLWLRRRARWLLFWMALFALEAPFTLLLLKLHIELPYTFAMGMAQVVGAMRPISLCFILLWLLRLRRYPYLLRLTQLAAVLLMLDSIVDGALIACSWQMRWMKAIEWGDALSAVVTSVFDFYPLALVCIALYKRRELNAVRWMVALLTFLDELLIGLRNLIKQGRQFTSWPLAEKIDAPLFTVQGMAISIFTIASALLLVAIIYAVYQSVREDHLRQKLLEHEKAQLLRTTELMRHHAEHDGLTGLWNHRVIVERLREELSHAQREAAPLSVILIDVDYFKLINDRHGHLAGDRVLESLGHVLLGALRGSDCIGRYGGEEFLLIMPGCSMSSALQRAEQLRRVVEQMRIVDSGLELRITASFGVVSDFDAELAAEEVIRMVDAALYQAKRNGRNCVVPMLSLDAARLSAVEPGKIESLQNG